MPTLEQKREAFEAEWATGTWQHLIKKDAVAEWDRHLQQIGLSIRQFTGHDVIDIGCGPTGIVYYIPECGRRVGVDPAKRSFDKWNRTYEQRHEIELLDCPAERLPFSDNSFHDGFCINCIDHTEDPNAVLQELHRVVKPGGRIVLHFDIDSPLRRLHKLVRPTCRIMHPQHLDWNWTSSQILDNKRFEITATYRNPEVFGSLRSYMYEAGWDDLIFRTTGSKTFINHLWIAAINAK